MKLKRAEKVAKELGIATETFLDWRDAGMPWIKIGKSIYVLEDSLIKWARNQEKIGNAQDAPGQDFPVKLIDTVIPPKNRRVSRGH
jgi:hypothetical protein